FDAASFAVDAVEFEQLAKVGDFQRAADLYRGDLLDGISIPDAGFEDWLLVERTRLHDLAVDVLSRVLATQTGEAAIATAHRLLQLEPAHEETHRALMRLYMVQGHRAQALRQYQICREALQRGLAVKPQAETEQLFRDLQSAANGATGATSSAIQQSAVPSVVERRSPETKVIPATSPTPQRQRVLARLGMRQFASRVSTLVVLVLLLGAVGATAWYFSPASQRSSTGTLADKPSIAVFPFDNLSADPEQGYFVDGMTDDLITDLSKVSGIFVIARNSSSTYKGKPVKVQQVAEDLGVRYVLQGSVQRQGDHVRINAQLID